MRAMDPAFRSDTTGHQGRQRGSDRFGSDQKNGNRSVNLCPQGWRQYVKRNNIAITCAAILATALVASDFVVEAQCESKA
jgi:hypothetical protein